MKKTVRRILCLLLTLCFVFTLLPVRASAALDSRVERAINWAIAIANDNSHGYSQTHRNGPDYDCSSFVSTAFRQGGFNVSGSNWTGSMEQAFTSVGFKAYAASSVTLQRGDILLRHDNVRQHTELYLGNNQLVGAHWDYDGRTGDSSGKEIDVYYDSAPSWHTRVLRYEGNSHSIKVTEYFNCNVTIQTTQGKRVNLYSQPTDSSYNDYYDRGGNLLSTYGAKLSDGSTWYRVLFQQGNKDVNLWLNAGSSGVKVIKIDPSITFSPSSVTMNPGESKTVSVSSKGIDVSQLFFDEGNQSICTAKWVGSTAITLTAHAPGNTVVSLGYTDTAGNEHIQGRINVTVNGKQNNEMPYTVLYYLNDSNGRHLGNSKILVGKVGEIVSPVPPEFDGYVTPATKSVVVKADLSTRIEYDYYIKKYTVTYNANGGSGAPLAQTKTYGKSIALSSQKPTRSGYSFKGWATSPGAASAQYQPGSSYSSNKDLMLYAVWESDKVESSLTLSANSITLDCGSSKTISISFKGKGVEKLHYTAQNTSICDLNWGETDLENGTSSLTVTGKKPGTVKITVYLLNDEGKYFCSQDFTVSVNSRSYTVFYDANGGAVLTSNETVTNGDIYGTLPTPTRNGYTFEGWYTARSGGSRVTADTVVNLTADQTLYAHWTNQPYTINFDANGGNIQTSSITVTNGSTYGALPTPARDGYTFEGWYTSRNGGSRVTADTTVNLTSGQTLYARWTNQLYTISFDANGGNVHTSTTAVTNGGTYGTLPTPVRDGYTFEGWYTSRSGGTQITTGTTVSLSGNQILYAHWEKEQTPSQPTISFVDVNESDWFAEPVQWAIEQNITTGTGNGTTFSPREICSVAQILTFIWRAYGSPEPAFANTFTDVPSGAYYEKPAVWAKEMGLIGGNKLDPLAPCTRAMAVNYLWRAAGSPNATASNQFVDVPSSNIQAVDWAVANGITIGTSDTTFSPKTTCTRAEIITFLYRNMA